MKSHACVYEALVFWKLCAEVLSCFDLLIAHCLKYQLKMFLFCGEIKILSKWPLLGSLSLWTRRVQNRVTHARGTWRLGFLQSHPKDRPGKSPWTASLSKVFLKPFLTWITTGLYLMLNCHSTNLNLHMGRFLFLYKLFQISRQTTIVVYVGSIRWAFASHAESLDSSPCCEYLIQ